MKEKNIQKSFDKVKKNIENLKTGLLYIGVAMIITAIVIMAIIIGGN